MTFKLLLKALYDYEADGEDELNFKENEILTVDEDLSEDDWYFGSKIEGDSSSSSNAAGYIPKTYVEPLKEVKRSVKAAYDYAAQESNELSILEGESIDILYEIDEDWWVGRNYEGNCGMIPSNYVTEAIDKEINEECVNEEADQPQQEYQQEEQQQQEYEYEQHNEKDFEPIEQQQHEFQEQGQEQKERERESQSFIPLPPPLPMKTQQSQNFKFEQISEPSESQSSEPSVVDEIAKSSQLKLNCDALFLDLSGQKVKGSLLYETSLYLCNNGNVEYCYDLEDLKNYEANEMKLELKNGTKMAIGLGKRDGKKLSELISEMNPSSATSKAKYSGMEAPMRAPIVEGPKMPKEMQPTSSSKTPSTTAAKPQRIPMVVGVSFEGTEGDEISIFEGEEVSIESSNADNDSNDSSQFVRIMKVNGVTGIVPRAFLLTRSEYQKQQQDKQEAERISNEMKAMKLKEENEATLLAQVSRNNSKSKLSKNNTNYASESTSVSKAASKSTPVMDDPWTALAITGKVPTATANSTAKPTIKLKDSRLWKDKSGKFQVEAEFVDFSDGKVTILKSSGSKVSVPIDILSDRDREYVFKKTGAVDTSSSNATKKNTAVNGFDWFPFFLSFGIDAMKSRSYAESFCSNAFEESIISAFTSDFLSSQGFDSKEIYKILPEAMKRKAKLMQDSAKEKHRNNTTQMVVSSGNAPVVKPKRELVKTSNSMAPSSNALANISNDYEQSVVDIQKFPSLEELEEIEMPRGKSQVKLSNGVVVQKTSTGPDDSGSVVIQSIPPVDSRSRERRREVVAADGSIAKEYTKITTNSSTVSEPFGAPMASMMMLQAQAQQQAQMQMQAQAQANAQMQMQTQAQMQARMQMQMQAQAQAQAQYQMQMQAQAQAQAQMQQRLQYQQQLQQQQQQQQPTVHITIQTGNSGNDKGHNSNMMSPMGGMAPLNSSMNMNSMIPNPMAMSQLNPMNSINSMNNMNNIPYNPMNPFNNNGFGF